MQLTQLDYDIQDRIIQKIHWVWLHESRKKEYLTRWCLVSITEVFWPVTWIRVSNDTILRYDWEKWEEEVFTKDETFRIIWLPPTLARVLYVLWSRYIYHHVYRYIYKEYDLDTYTDWKDAIILKAREYCERKLLNDDWTSATLRDQSVSTKEKIYQIIK